MWNVDLALNAFTFVTQHPDQHDQRWYRRARPAKTPTMCFAGHVVHIGLGMPFQWVQGPKADPHVFSYVRVGEKTIHVPALAEGLLRLSVPDAQGLFHAQGRQGVEERLRTILEFSPASRDLGPDVIEAAIRKLELLATGD